MARAQLLFAMSALLVSLGPFTIATSQTAENEKRRQANRIGEKEQDRQLDARGKGLAKTVLAADYQAV